MKMKWKNKFFGLLAVSLLAGSCKKELELKDPQFLIPQDALGWSCGVAPRRRFSKHP